MLTAGIKVKVLAFLVLGLLATSYLGMKYVGVDLAGSGYDVTVSLPEAGGLFENGEVTYRGVPVGRIDGLTATEDGVDVHVRVDGHAPVIPADVTARVHDRSSIGEQYLDLQASSTDGPRLAAGDRIDGGPESLPPSIAKVLEAGRDLVASVPSDSLDTVIDESYELSRGAGDDLARLLRTSQQFVETADRNFLVTSALIDNSDRVLRTQQESASSIASFSSDLDTIATTLRDDDASLRRLIDHSPAAAHEIGLLFDQVGTPLGILMSNLVSTAQIFGTNAAGVQDALIRVPEAMSIGWAVNGSQGMNLGLAQTYFDPLPCTSGYEGTTLRTGLQTARGRPFNADAGCTADPDSGSDVRGPMSIPDTLSGAAARVDPVDSMDDLLGGSR